MPLSPPATERIVPVRNYADGDVHVFTDGALSLCKITRIQFGGWGVFMRYKDNEKTLSGAKADTSTQEMEFEAVRQAVLALTEKNHSKTVRIYIDNQWVVEAIHRYKRQYDPITRTWKKDAWVNSGGRNAHIKAFVREIIEKSPSTFLFYWIKGHSDIQGNDRADALAVAARKRLKESHAITVGETNGQ